MPLSRKRKITKRDIPKDFEDLTVKTINRIAECQTVAGMLFLRNDMPEMYTVSETVAQNLSSKLPALIDSIHRAVTEISSLINKINPVIDRIMEDESVEGVIMTNKEGAPILTNMSLTRATQYSFALHKFGNLAQQCIRELDPFDKILVMRLNTKKIEMIAAPDLEFNIIIIQHFRHKTQENEIESR